MKPDKGFNDEYLQWLSGLKDIIRRSQLSAALKVNAEMLGLYWQLGHAITVKQADAAWGDKIIDQLSIDLSSEFSKVKGFSRSNLFNITKWYRFYAGITQLVQQHVGLMNSSEMNRDSPIVQQSVGLFPPVLGIIPWGHHILIFTKIKNVPEAIFYIQQTATHDWTRALLEYHIESGLYHQKGKGLNNFSSTLPKLQGQLANDFLSNTYNLDFLGLTEDATEQDLKNAILANIKKFLLAFGTGFSFYGQQHRIKVGGKDFYLDLLFYHTQLHCFFVVELKVTDFEPEFVGKLGFYVTAVDKQLRSPVDNPTIGLLLVKSADKMVVEYSLTTESRPIGISEYKHKLPDAWKKALPDEEILKTELAKEITVPVNPMDEKLDQLKSLINKLGGVEADIEKTMELTEQIYNKILLPLKDLVAQKIRPIAEYFNKIFIDFWYNSSSINNFPDVSQLGNLFNANGNIWMLGFNVRLEGLKKGKTKAFNTNGRLEIKLDKYHYQLGVHPELNWREDVYRTFPTEIELQRYAEMFVTKLIDEISPQVQQLLKQADSYGSNQ
jgi:predicted nuclease of restriction endonuclease-like (RecB) superfamily